MGDYFTGLTSHESFETIQGLMAQDICPFLFYNLTPYIFTLSKRGWFNWVIAHRDRTFRKSINKRDFSKKQVNRLYPNEVLVRCPNPFANVVSGVGPWHEDRIKIRILNSDTRCPAKHRAGDRFVMQGKDTGDNCLAFNMMFPRVLYLTRTGEQFRSSKDSCQLNSRIIVAVSRMIFPCRYHKRKRVFENTFLPDGFCCHLFLLIYPHVLALMYNGHLNGDLRIKHPDIEGFVELTLHKESSSKNNLLRGLKSIAARLFSAVYYPIDLIDYTIAIEVRENEASQCCVKKGRKYMVNMGKENFLCPASFHVLYPFMTLASSGYNFQWNHSCNTNLVPCPDCVGAVYSIDPKRNIVP